MRWRRKKKPLPKVGDEREITRFLWLPTCINGECRWLERARTRQRYRAIAWDDVGGAETDYGWMNFDWGVEVPL